MLSLSKMSEAASVSKTFRTHEQLLLSGYTYHSEKGPFWQVDDLTTTPTKRYTFPVWDRLFSLQLLHVRYCVGTYDLATQHYIPCPYKQKVKPPYQNCYPCFKAIGFNPAFYNVSRSQLSLRQQAYNQEPHCTYLAYFGPGIIKVGIALKNRVLKRWLEQGARAAVVLQTFTDAYQARCLEAQISEKFHLPERITVTKKKQLLAYTYLFEEAALALVRCQEAITQALSLKGVGYTIQDLQVHYSPIALPNPLVDVDQTKQSVSGRILGMVGDLVVYETGGCFWMSSLKKYIGQAYVHQSAAPAVTQASFSFLSSTQ